jgi:hypothetical protein
MLTDTTYYSDDALLEQDIPAHRLGAQKSYRIRTSDVVAAMKFRSKAEADQLMWLHRHCIKGDLGLAEVAKRLLKPGGEGECYSFDTIRKALTTRGSEGGTEKSYARIAEAIKTYRVAQETADAAIAPGLVRTPLMDRVFQMCETARVFHRPVLIYGDSQSGKTVALEAYTTYSKAGTTYLFRLPNEGRAPDLIRMVGRQLNVQATGSIAEILFRVCDSLTSSDLVIFDEIHNAFRYERKDNAVKTMNFIREIWDRVKCPMVLAGSPLVRKAFHEAEYGYKDALQEFFRRSLLEYSLPDRPTPKDLIATAAGYGLPPAQGDALKLQTAIIAEHGQGVWFEHLEAARRIAANLGQALAWDHVIGAKSVLDDIANGDVQDDAILSNIILPPLPPVNRPTA